MSAIPFVGPSYALSARKADIQRSVNMYLLGLETPGKAPFILHTVPGYTLFCNLGGVVRGTLTTNDRCFWVAGATLYEVLSDGSSVSRGTLLTTSGPVELAYGTSQLVIVDGSYGYVLALGSNAFAQITAAGFYGSNTVTFLDNYFIFVRPLTGQFYISAINNALTFDPLDFATAESQPDNLIATVAVQRRLLLIGSLTTEIWFDDGNVDFPFDREGTTIEVGCLAPHSVRQIDNTAFMVGRDKNGGGIVYRLNGYQWVRISTQAIEQAIQASTDLSAAVAYAYQENGLTFYAINAPGLTSTWVYEVSTGAWHERCDLDGVGQFKADRGVCHAYAFGYHLIGGSDGKVYRLDRSVHTKNGDALVRERTSPHFAQPALQRQFFPAFFLDATTGVTGQGVSPSVYLSWSGDAGKSWSNPIGRSTGQVGQRINRIEWRRLGGGRPKDRDRIWKLRISDNASFSIINAQVPTVVGAS